jgi:hypothetical protein
MSRCKCLCGKHTKADTSGGIYMRRSEYISMRRSKCYLLLMRWTLPVSVFCLSDYSQDVNIQVSRTNSPCSHNICFRGETAGPRDLCRFML